MRGVIDRIFRSCVSSRRRAPCGFALNTTNRPCGRPLPPRIQNRNSPIRAVVLVSGNQNEPVHLGGREQQTIGCRQLTASQAPLRRHSSPFTRDRFIDRKQATDIAVRHVVRYPALKLLASRASGHKLNAQRQFAKDQDADTQIQCRLPAQPTGYVGVRGGLEGLGNNVRVKKVTHGPSPA
jgi:hypothetical protein